MNSSLWRAGGTALALTISVMIAMAPGQASASTGVSQIGPTPSANTAGVECIQQALGVTADGEYGQETYDAVKDFQSEHSLSVDGAVGPSTGELLWRSGMLPTGCEESVPTTSLTDEDVAQDDPLGPGILV